LFTASHEIQRISPVIDIFFRRFSKFDHRNLLVFLSSLGQSYRFPTKQNGGSQLFKFERFLT
jgi:hypothetical protein